MQTNEIELGAVITDIAAGPFGSNLKVSSFVDSGFPIVDGANLKGYKVTDNITKFVTEEKARSLHRSIAHRGDVVVTISGTVGQISYIPEDSQYSEYLCSQRQFRATFDTSRVYVPYLVFYFHTYEGQHKILSFANQTGVPALAQPLKNFRQIRLCLPEFMEQRKIASVIEKINDKIEKNEAINHNLQQQFQALFDSWFKRFEPFSQPKYESELGLIPEGWSVKDIYSISSIIYGAPFSSKLFNDEHKGSPIVRIRDLKTQNTSTYTTEIHPKGYLIQNGDIIVGMDGEFRPYIWGSGEAWLNQRVCVFENKRPKGKVFLFCSIKPLLNLIEQTEVATTVIHIGKQDFDAFRIVMPPIEILNAFDDITAPMYNRIVNNIMENHRLSALRDSLLPRLMSGEINVSEVEL